MHLWHIDSDPCSCRCCRISSFRKAPMVVVLLRTKRLHRMVKQLLIRRLEYAPRSPWRQCRRCHLRCDSRSNEIVRTGLGWYSDEKSYWDGTNCLNFVSGFLQMPSLLIYCASACSSPWQQWKTNCRYLLEWRVDATLAVVCALSQPWDLIQFGTF